MKSNPKESSSSQSKKSKNPTPDNSPPPPKESAPPSSSSSLNKEDPDDYLSEYHQAPIGLWDPLKVHNICNVKGEFKLPKMFPWFPPLIYVKKGENLVCDGYVFNCNNQKRAGKSKHYVYEDRSCTARINKEGWDKVTSEKEEHTCNAPINLIEKLLKWYLYQTVPVSKDVKAYNLAVKATKHLSNENLKLIPDRNQLVKYICDKRHDLVPHKKSAMVQGDLVLTEELKMFNGDEVFLLHDDGPTAEARIICYATQQNLEPLRDSETWLCDGTFAVCPRLFTNYGLYIPLLKTRCSHLPTFCFLGQQKRFTQGPLKSFRRVSKPYPVIKRVPLAITLEPFQMMMKRMKPPFLQNNKLIVKSQKALDNQLFFLEVKKPHNLGTPTKYPPEQENPPFD
ncbi:hypothetical protein DSO57_1002456 [Entomophthora muscae]|uniref:Uncharacterized protein n=1 Tax=Entomophthora muscae TaxID=34485 RepID=A0ACC2RZM9_9FUNG|nr:hypothetical protein DSO57_1002456 [Entomophthora muscae]